jgi:MATE family multidrug resistance protein
VTSASLFYQIPYALSVAAAVRCGNLLGAQRPALARTTSRVVLAIAVIIAGFNSLLLVVFRHVWGRMFSSEEDVIAIVAGVLPLVALFQLTDGLSGATGGLLRGAGKAPLGAIINHTSYYVIGLPKLGLQGLWWGLTAALTWTAILTSTVVWRMNWEEESEKARIRMGVVKRDPEL